MASPKFVNILEPLHQACLVRTISVNREGCLTRWHGKTLEIDHRGLEEEGTDRLDGSSLPTALSLVSKERQQGHVDHPVQTS